MICGIQNLRKTSPKTGNAQSSVYVGEVTHHRLQPIDHAFHFPLYFYGFDLSELPRLDQEIGLFGYNRFRPVAIHDKDYLEEGPDPIETKLRRCLEKSGCTTPVSRIQLVTAARYFNYVFNPVSFYLCFTQDEALQYVVAEVNNTFGERHLYVIDDLENRDGTWVGRSLRTKEFHVSPFHSMDGDYEFTFTLEQNKLDIRVNLVREGRPVFLSSLQGYAMPLQSNSLRKTVARFPLTASITFPRILAQAAKLHYGKKLPIYRKPDPVSDMTIRRRPPGRVERFGMKILLRMFGALEKGSIRLILPDGSEHSFGRKDPGPRPSIQIKRYAFFKKLVQGGSVGFGESYVDGDWDSDDLTGLLGVLANNRDALEKQNRVLSWVGEGLDRLRHLNRRNTRRKSRQNIHDHYDLGNDFYQSFLDPSMMYSSALYLKEDDSLEQAQLNKIQKLIDKADIKPDHHILEIGSGWGSFAIQAAHQTGCRVTTITLSEEQKKLADQRIKAANLEDRVEVKLLDYRDIEGQFDRIVSIEMLEAVGQEYFETFFQTCDRLLKPGGRVVIQVIAMPDERYESYRKGCDWIQKHIFPGGHLPSLSALKNSTEGSSTLRICETDDIGIHYARTLREWRENFLRNFETIRDLGFDEDFKRKWVYYLCYCEAGFSTHSLHVYHLVLTRPKRPESI